MTRASTEARVLRGTLVNALAMAAGALGALFPLLVARLLGEAALGAYALAWATADLLSKVGTFGLDQTTIAVVARLRDAGDRSGIHAAFGKALASGLGISLLAAALAAAAFAWTGTGADDGMRAARLLMLLALPSVALYRISNGVSRGLGIMKHDILSGGLAENVTTLVLLVALVAAGLPATIGPALVPVLAAVGGFTAGGLVAWALARGAVRRAAGPAPPAGSAPGLLRQSAQVGAAGFVNLALTRLDVLVLGAYVGSAPGLSAAGLGVYCAAVEVAGVCRKIRQAVEAPVLHAVASESGRGASGTEVAAEAGRWVLAVLLLVAGCLSFGAPLVLGLFGPGFGSGASWLVILVAAQVVYSYSGLAEAVLLVRRPALNVLNAVLAVLVSLGLCLALVPRFGAGGAAVATLAGHIALAGLRFSELAGILRTPWPWTRNRPAVVAFVAACAPAAAARWLVPGPAGAAVAIGAFLVLYGAIGGIPARRTASLPVASSFRAPHGRAPRCRAEPPS